MAELPAQPAAARIRASSLKQRMLLFERLPFLQEWSSYNGYAMNIMWNLHPPPPPTKRSHTCGVCGLLFLALVMCVCTLFYLDVVRFVYTPASSIGSAILFNTGPFRSLAQFNMPTLPDHPAHVSYNSSTAHVSIMQETLISFHGEHAKHAQESQTSFLHGQHANHVQESVEGSFHDEDASDGHQHVKSSILEVIDSQQVDDGVRALHECNLFEGKWVRDDSYPLYNSEACPFIDPGFRCQENGRPDRDYLSWRWQPYGCDLPRFNAEEMVERLRGKRMVFVGDSIGRNQWESMLCMLARGVQNKSTIYEANGQPISKHTGFLSYVFQDFNFTVEYFRSPFLVPQTRAPPGSHPNVSSTLRVDTMDWSSKQWLPADFLIFNTGHWWSYEKTMRGGCYFQVGSHANMSMDEQGGFGRAMQTWGRWVAQQVDLNRTQVFFRNYAPAHFSGGTWKTGGQCHEETQPWLEGTIFEDDIWTNPYVQAEILRLQANVEKYDKRRVQMLDITGLSNYRKDAHSSIYHVSKLEPRPMHHQDCSHWCLPGVPDTWNELLIASLDSH